ncbi:MAG: monovalent cation/H+ antiporter subunit A [Candidatus Roseilinea sp.]|nr:MAG: monovalent cation/H+ antiporter subunit A [Candidatus Roseilinea sp.]
MNDALVISLVACAVGASVAGVFTASVLGQRIPTRVMGWLLAIAPAIAFVALLAQSPAVLAGQTLSWSVAWIPSLGLHFSLLLDGLSLLFALLVSGIGALVVMYAGYYFAPKHGDEKSGGGDGESDSRTTPTLHSRFPNTDARFFFYILLFMTSMLGLVLAGDVITLFVFWEGTSITSFLLVAYKSKEEDARKGAFRALFITGGGGVALLAGLVFASSIAGSTGFADILRQGDALRANALYPVMFGLIALGALTKSAQAPAHFWLPGAMSAPAPASAYLHSATMVKAGVYLLARLHPALGLTDLWFWVLSLVGLATMLIGAYVGFKQNDLKALLAYSTVSQLGILVMLIGQDTEIAFKALVVSILAHALYKSALFLITGIVDHEAGTRDLRQLGGIWRAMPATFAVAAVAALSMAGLPPLFGFLAKETLLATATHPNVPAIVDVIFPAAAVVAGALILAQAGLIVLDAFWGKPKAALHPHEAPIPMWVAPAVPAVISLAIGVLPEPEALATLLARAAAASYGAPVKVSLALWTGINIPLALSAVAVTIGAAILALRGRLRPLFTNLSGALSLEPLYAGALRTIDGLAWLVTRVQNGKLRLYLAIMLISAGLMMVTIGRLSLPTLPPLVAGPQPALAALRVFLLLVIGIAALASVLLRRDLFAIFALAASGLSIAVLMILEPAPDIALVQVVVETLTLVVLVLVLTRLPREQRERAFEFTFRQTRPSLVRDLLIALGSGAVMFAIVLTALGTRPRESQMTPFYEQNAKPLTSANDIVGAIVIDFRGFDTFVEIVVFAAAGLAIYTLLRYASRKAGDRDDDAPALDKSMLPFRGIASPITSPFVRALALLLLPFTMLLAVTHVLYGHDQPGDGFTAGVILSLGMATWYVVFGYAETKRRLPWLTPGGFIGSGLLLAIGSATAAALINGSFFSPVDFGKLLGIGFLPQGVYFSTATLFELAICLTVTGSAVLMLDTLGHPKDSDAETARQMDEIAVLRQRGEVTLDETAEIQEPEVRGQKSEVRD